MPFRILFHFFSLNSQRLVKLTISEQRFGQFEFEWVAVAASICAVTSSSEVSDNFQCIRGVFMLFPGSRIRFNANKYKKKMFVKIKQILHRKIVVFFVFPSTSGYKSIAKHIDDSNRTKYSQESKKKRNRVIIARNQLFPNHLQIIGLDTSHGLATRTGARRKM